MQINFFHHQQRLVVVGHSDNSLSNIGGRREVFEIAADEKLIGCELYKLNDLIGVTWLKMKIHA